MPSRLCSSDLAIAIADIQLIARSWFFEEIGSTSDWAKDLIRRAGPKADLHGTLAVAHAQTAGRGRLGRTWESPPGRSLLFSLILRPLDGVTAADFDRTLSAAAPVAVCEAISETAGLKPSIKYPNDVLLAGRKVAGILIERIAAAGSPGFCVLGIGVNVNQSASELPADARVPATSLALAAAGPVDLSALLGSLLRRIEANLNDPERAARRMAALCDTVGRMITVRTHDGVLHGLALACQPDDGSLLVRLDSGMEVSVLSGDIEQLDQNVAQPAPVGESPAEGQPCEF